MTYAVNEKTLNLLAELSKLHLTEEEKKRFMNQLKEIVSYISKIKELKTGKTAPSFHSVNIKNVFNASAVSEKKSKRSFTQKEALSQAKEKQNGYFVVPRILEK